MVRRGVNVSRQGGDIGPSKNYRNALDMVKYQAKGLYGVLSVVQEAELGDSRGLVKYD